MFSICRAKIWCSPSQSLFLSMTFQIADGGEIRLSVIPVTFFVNNFSHLASGSNLCVSSFLSPDTFSFRALQ